ncbi:MAG: hydrophobe/amphiphile efflux-1 family RND transporter [Deltaproteobacteria bacterium]|nr:MAG: hydrophobe/amphiphile efflux-1 family RND transporter [Deltaproteobacteria bacterium]
MFSKFFIERPVFASVISIIIVLGGILGLQGLGVEDYPNLTPPQISVQAIYPGADAATISNTVAGPIEEAINGIENMIYMQTTSSSSGKLTINVFFEIGTDPLKANINVNNRVQAITSSLPSEVQRFGVTVNESSTSMLGVAAFYSPDDSMDATTLNNYVNINIKNEIARVNGIGNVVVYGSKDYSVRIWIKPDLLTKYNLTPTDIISRVREQNSQYSAGKLGQSPMKDDVAFVYTLKVKGRLTDIDQFKNIILRSHENGQILRLKDVADVELGANAYNFQGLYNGEKTMIPMAFFMQSGANALATMDGVKSKLAELEKNFNNGLSYDVVYDTTDFVKTSINEVLKTFGEAILLVLIVIYLFLKNLRATIIPMIAVPVSILGTFGVLYLLGFSVNLITLFALLLAIGIVVDDAIIVIENVERILRSNPDISAKEASIQAMDEVGTAVISIVLVLSAVFIPVAFLGGFAGQIQKEFALTLVSSVIISGFVALTLTPSLCAVFLKKEHPKPLWIVEKFNDFFDWSTKIFTASVARVLRHVIPSLLVAAILFFSAYKLLNMIPTALLPKEDKGVIIAFNSLPAGYTLPKTENTSREIAKTILKNPNIKRASAMVGFDLATNTLKENASVFFIKFKDWSKRPEKNQSSFAIADMYNKMFWLTPNSQIFFANPPPISGMGMRGGFEIYLQSKTGKTYEEIAKDVQKLFAVARKRPELNPMRLNTSLVTNVPQYNIIVDKDKLKMLNINISDVFATLNATAGKYYINDFNMFGKTYKVNIRAKEKYRSGVRSLSNIFVRSTTGKMVSLASIIKLERYTGPSVVNRFNLYPATRLTGVASPGYTSGQALKAFEESVFEALSKNEYSLGYGGSTYQEKQTQSSSGNAFIFGMIFVFLILAAQYERWIMPFAIVSAVPFAVLGSLAATFFAHLSNDIYFQIGLLVLIGLSAKNAILIVEFAMEARKKGASLFDAAVEASRLRFRPIVMTSIAFTLGVVPMVTSTGAGAASRHALGTGVIGGMIVASTVALLFIPLFFYIFEGLSEWIGRKFSSNKKTANVE